MIVKSISILCSSILPKTNPGIFHVITVLLTSLRTAFPALWCDVTTTTSYICVDANLLKKILQSFESALQQLGYMKKH